MPSESLAEQLSVVLWLIVCFLSLTIIVPLMQNLAKSVAISCGRVIYNYIYESMELSLRYNVTLRLMLPILPNYKYEVLITKGHIIVYIGNIKVEGRGVDVIREYRLVPGKQYVIIPKDSTLVIGEAYE